MNKEKVDWRIVVTGIICIAILEAIALMNGINGTLLIGVIATIACAIGVMLPNPIKTN